MQTVRKDSDDALIGGDVFSSDGEWLGKTWDVQDESFQVECSYQPDYWLPLNTVNSADAQRIVLTFPQRDLDRYKATQPRATGRWHGLLSR